jgi:predicted DCC family thiol-disulfide oxidoreductase YuxK
MNDIGGNPMVVLYDDGCGFCKGMLAVLLRWDRAHHLRAVPIQCTQGEQLLGDMPPGDRLKSWHLLDGETVHSGGAAIPVILLALPHGAPLARATARFPSTTSRAYEWIADHRAIFGRSLPQRASAWAARVIGERRRTDQNNSS